MNQVIYESPRGNISLDDCLFYHTMEIPSIGLVRGLWDLRSREQEYLGEVNFSSRRVLEIGSASGFLTFFMESLGAEVIACDLPTGDCWDIVPYAGFDLQSYNEARNRLHRMLINGFWLAHQACKSKAGVMYTSIYELPADLGQFDISTFGMVLLHIRDPFLALKKVLEHTQKTVIITELFPWSYMPREVQQVFRPRTDLILTTKSTNEFIPDRVASIISEESPKMFFCPNFAIGEPKDRWWQFTPTIIQEFIGTLGFRTEKILYHYQLYFPNYQQTSPERMNIKQLLYPCFTVVGQRTTIV